MNAVLGLSMTSNGIGWALLDGATADATILDHDHFDLGADSAIDGDIARHRSAVRGAQAIARASGLEVGSVALTWTGDVEAKASLLLASLRDNGFDTVTGVALPEAARLWAGADRQAGGHRRCAVCVVESAAVTVATVLEGSTHVTRTQMRESTDGLARWLTGAFADAGAQPECVYLIASRGDRELIAGPLTTALPMPVVASDEAQLGLARGAALMLGVAPARVAETPPVVRSRQTTRRLGIHLRAAAALAAGAIALFAVGPALAGRSEPATPENARTSEIATESDSSTTAVSVHAVLPTASVPVAPPPAALPEASPVTDVEYAQEPLIVEEPVTESVVAAVPVETTVAVDAQPAVAPQAPIVAEPVMAQPAPPAPPIAAPVPNPVVPPQDPLASVLSPIFGGLP